LKTTKLSSYVLQFSIKKLNIV